MSEQIKTWNCPTLASVLTEITGQAVTVEWCDEKGNPRSRKGSKSEPTHLVASLIQEPYVEYKLKKVPGFVKLWTLGEVRSEGPNAFVVIRDETVFVRAIYRSGRQ